MALINITTPADGESADAADVATPLNTIVSEINGNLDNANIKSGAAIATSKLASDAGITAGMLSSALGNFGAWQTYTPSTRNNITVGNGTETAKYCQIGKIVYVSYKLVCGTTTSIGNDAGIAPPVTPHSFYATNQFVTVGTAFGYDVGNFAYPGFAVIGDTDSSDTIGTRWLVAGQTYTGSGFPFTEGSGDILTIQATYEAA